MGAAIATLTSYQNLNISKGMNKHVNFGFFLKTNRNHAESAFSSQTFQNFVKTSKVSGDAEGWNVYNVPSNRYRGHFLAISEWATKKGKAQLYKSLLQGDEMGITCNVAGCRRIGAWGGDTPGQEQKR